MILYTLFASTPLASRLIRGKIFIRIVIRLAIFFIQTAEVNSKVIPLELDSEVKVDPDITSAEVDC